MTKFLIAMIIVVLAISIYSLQSVDDNLSSELDYTSEPNEALTEVKTTKEIIDSELENVSSAQKPVAEKLGSKANTAVDIDGLPYSIQLLGLVFSKVESESLDDTND